MEIREITPDASLHHGAQDGIVKKLQQSMGRPAPRPAPVPTPAPQPTPKPPVPVQPQYKPPAKQVDWLLPQHKPKVVVRPAPEKVAFMQPAELIQPTPIPPQPTMSAALASTPSMHREAPIPLFVPPVQEYDYVDTETAYPQKPAFKLPKSFWKNEQQSVNLDTKNKMDVKTIGKLVGESGIGLALIYFGLTSSGSYYTPASRFAGDLATVFYEYQLGILMATIGSILIYDAIKRAGNL